MAAPRNQNNATLWRSPQSTESTYMEYIYIWDGPNVHEVDLPETGPPHVRTIPLI